MSPRHLTAFLALLTTSLAQSSQVTWASVIFTYHGEKLPAIDPSGPWNLSPLGANQSYSAGDLFRQRYFTDNGTVTQLSGSVPINGLRGDQIDNSQIYAMGTSDEFVGASALAFMQGLYPPSVNTVMSLEDTAADGSAIQYPLGGYQYPNIGSVGAEDFNYIWIAGNIGCANYGAASAESIFLQANSSLSSTYQPFYDSLNSTIFAGIDPSLLSYYNAYALYEYALYQSQHNTSSPVSPDELSLLRYLASLQQYALNAPSETFGNIPSISGRTLAAFVLQQFAHNTVSGGVSDKLTLLFGSFEPMLALFALSGLSRGPSAGLFNNSLPLHGSSMVFELFSNTPSSSSSSSSLNTTTPYPDNSELKVRFSFRNGTGQNSPLIEYSLFGRGNSEDVMSLDDFLMGMGAFSMDDVGEWCESCGPVTTLFCQGVESLNSSSPLSPHHNKNGITPTVAGVIGATVTLALLILSLAILALLGFRVDYRGRSLNSSSDAVGGIGVLRRNGGGGNGGFKGAEKLASDTDVTLKLEAGASVVRHERVGSWELREAERRSEELDRERGAFGEAISPVDHV